MTTEEYPGRVVIRSAEEIRARQGIPHFVGVLEQEPVVLV